jgi:predicted HAD superfamily Cof-like phosphohydrolase
MTKLNEQLLEFHKTFGHRIGKEGPEIPSDAEVRLRAALILEEAMEFLEACVTPPFEEVVRELRAVVLGVARRAPLAPNLVEMADALADIMYVTEGSFISLGIDGQEVLDEVHRANMAKVGGGKDESMKPEGWQPVLARQVLRMEGHKLSRGLICVCGHALARHGAHPELAECWCNGDGLSKCWCTEFRSAARQVCGVHGGGDPEGTASCTCPEAK